jgi:lipid-binding SYLF domain-containing protein
VTTLLLTCSLAHLAPSPGETLRAAVAVLTDLQQVPHKGIPAKLLAESEAVVIVPNVVKAGFVIGGRAGHGVAVVRTKEGWGEVRFVALGGASVGFQVGVQSSDVVLVFKTRGGLDRLLDGKAKLQLGADASVAAGPVGRDAAAGTDGKLRAEIYSYGRARGLFAGVALQGAVLAADRRAEAAFARDAGPETLRAADELKAKLAVAAGTAPAAAPPTVPDRPARP